MALSVVFSDDVVRGQLRNSRSLRVPLPERADSAPYVVGSYGRSESVVFLRRKEITGRIGGSRGTIFLDRFLICLMMWVEADIRWRFGLRLPRT